MRITFLVIIISTLYACEKAIVTNGLWISDTYDFLYIASDTIYYYEKNCIVKNVFIRKNKDNYYYSNKYLLPCMGLNKKNEDFFVKKKITNKNVLCIYNKNDSCFISLFGKGDLSKDKVNFRRLTSSNTTVQWDSLVVTLSVSYQDSIFTTTIKNIPYKNDCFFHPHEGKIMNLDMEVWLLTQKEHDLAKYISSHPVIRAYHLYYEGQKIANKTLYHQKCYFKCIDNIVLERCKKVVKMPFYE